MVAQHEERPIAAVAQPPRPRLEVECAVYRAGREYRAVCLDLGLIVERPTADDALDELLALIEDYVADSRRRGLSPREMLRPVPRNERLHVYRRLALAALSQWLGTRFQWSGRRRPPREGFTHRYYPV